MTNCGACIVRPTSDAAGRQSAWSTFSLACTCYAVSAGTFRRCARRDTSALPRTPSHPVDGRNVDRRLVEHEVGRIEVVHVDALAAVVVEEVGAGIPRRPGVSPRVPRRYGDG